MSAVAEEVTLVEQANGGGEMIDEVDLPDLVGDALSQATISLESSRTAKWLGIAVIAATLVLYAIFW